LSASRTASSSSALRGGGDAVEPGLILQHLVGREEGIEHDFLRHDPDRTAGVAAVAIDIEAPDLRCAAGLGDEARQNVDQRRFACAIGAEQAENRALRHIEADPAQRQLAFAHRAVRALGRGVAFDKVVDADGGFGGHGASPRQARCQRQLN
jgi:hypothetical protein